MRPVQPLLFYSLVFLTILFVGGCVGPKHPTATILVHANSQQTNASAESKELIEQLPKFATSASIVSKLAERCQAIIPDQGADPVKYLQKVMLVKPASSEEPELHTLTVFADNHVYSAVILKCWLEVLQQEIKETSTPRISPNLVDNIKQAGKELADAESQVKQYLEANPELELIKESIDLEAQLSAANSFISDFRKAAANKQIDQPTLDRILKGIADQPWAKLSQLASAAAKDPSKQSADSLTTDIQMQRIKIKQLENTFGPGHPELEAAKKQLAVLEAKLPKGAGTKESKPVPGLAVSDQVMSQKIEKAFQERTAKINEKLNEIKMQRVMQDRLKSEYENQREKLNALMQRLHKQEVIGENPGVKMKLLKISLLEATNAEIESYRQLQLQNPSLPKMDFKPK